MIICISYREPALLDHLFSRYSSSILDGGFRTCVLSARQLGDNGAVTFLIPAFDDYYETASVKQVRMRSEIFISDEEKQWAENWFSDNGVGKDDQVIAVVDSSNSRSKMLPHSVYFSVLKFFLENRNTKILIFDEHNAGKRRFYEAWLRSNLIDRFIFAEGTTLRESMRILSSHSVKFIFGPCTGILHCAEGIYNVLLQRGLRREDLPVMLTYRGNQKHVNDNPYRWWGNSIVDCMLIKRNITGEKEVRLLSDEDADINVALNNLLECSDFNAELVTNFIKTNYTATLARRTAVVIR